MQASRPNTIPSDPFCVLLLPSLAAEKGRLTSEYERALSDVRSKFIEAQSRVELQDRSLKEKDDAAKVRVRLGCHPCTIGPSSDFAFGVPLKI